jgi:hypothetical protein
MWKSVNREGYEKVEFAAGRSEFARCG